MKALLLCVGTLLSFNGALAGDPSLMFPEQKIELPPFSLSEIAKQNLPAFKDIPPAESVESIPTKLSADKFVITPRNDVDYKLLIKQPDPSIDYRLIVKDLGASWKK